MLGGDRRRPFPGCLASARLAGDTERVEQPLVSIVPLGTLPACVLEEDAAEGLLTGEERRQSEVAGIRQLLPRVYDVIDFAVLLSRTRPDVRDG